MTDDPEALLALAEEAIARVRELHKKSIDRCSICVDYLGINVVYPCQTIQALDGEQ